MCEDVPFVREDGGQEGDEEPGEEEGEGDADAHDQAGYHRASVHLLQIEDCLC